MLRTELYLLVANQTQHNKTAQVEADFAFPVLDRPAESDRQYGPWVLFYRMFAALLAVCFSVLWVAMLRRIRD